MATNAIHTWGTILERTGNTIAEITSITGPELSLNAVDVTHLTSPNTFKEFIGGMRDGGEVAIEGNFYSGDTNGQIGLYDDLVAAIVQDFVITFPNGTTWTFKALVTAFGVDTPLDDKVPFKATMKVTAKPTLGITALANMTAWAGTEENAGAALVPVPNPWVAGTYLYNCVVNTLSTYIIMTCTQATATIVIINGFNGIESTVLTGIPSGQLALDAADTITDFTVRITDAGKSPIEYVFRIVRP